MEDVEKDVSTLKCGFDSLKEDVAVLESASSELLHLSSEIGPCLEEHSQQTEKQFPKIKMSVEDKILAADKLEEFTHPCGGSGWKLAVYEDFRNTPCPNGWEQTGYEEKPYTCGIDVTGGSICAQAMFPLRDGILEYNKVCGRVKAYQFGTPDAFAASNQLGFSGIGITHGPSPTIIWALVAGTTNDDSDSAMGRCPCDGVGTDPSPPEVGDNYFCESVIDNPDPGTTFDNVFFSKDILWDEIGCTSSDDCCSRFTGPYFIRQLDSPTTDDIDISICNDEGRDFENFAVELIEIYVK